MLNNGISMPWQITYHPDTEIVEVIYTGANGINDIYEATAASIRETKERASLKVLLDFSEAKISLNLLDTLKFPDKFYNDLKADRLVRVAVVEPKSTAYKSLTRFFVTASNNRGWSVQSFTTRDEAFVWLNSEAD